ncbi:IS5 family transposase [Streptomyces anulatus]|uniref:IS5 family transposase n=1 Tax=Streptomyces anulatus TaxID=1892 RepID=UPI00386E9D63
MVNGILHRVRTGVQWRDLPERYGPWKTVYERHRRWSADGTWERLLQQVQAQADAAGGDRLGRLGRLHLDPCPPACGRRAEGSAARRVKRGGRDGTPERKTMGETVRPPGGGGAGGEALGRSRGGFTTKIHLSADERCRVLSLLLTAGQRADCLQFEPVMERIRVPRLGPGRLRTTPDSVSADKAYSNRRTRRYLRRRGICHVIPEKSDQAVNRVRRGRSGGRPPSFDKERYKKRNTVERAINKLKNYRAVSTRYDKRAYVYLGTVTVAATIIWLRT